MLTCPKLESIVMGGHFLDEVITIVSDPGNPCPVPIGFLTKLYPSWGAIVAAPAVF